jgi:RhoGEF domain
MYYHISSIRDLNKRFLDDLELRFLTWNDLSLIGDMFLTFAPFFRMYTGYAESHERVGPLLSQINRAGKYEVFREFEAKQRANPDYDRTRLTQVLSIPIQRYAWAVFILLTLLCVL